MTNYSHSYPLFYEHPHNYRYNAQVVALFSQQEITSNFPQLKEMLESYISEKTRSLWGILLDRTLAYPGGGGQVADRGVLETSNIVSEHLTTFVLPEDDIAGNKALLSNQKIVHLCDTPIPVGTNVVGTIDETNRYDFQQQHSAQHLLSAVAYKTFGFNTLSIHLSKNYSTIDFDTKQISEFTLLELETIANNLCKENKRISSREVDPLTLTQLELRRLPKDEHNKLRIVTIEDIDVTACCGVHCASTAHLAPIFITQVRSLKGKTQITFLAGRRALNKFRNYHGVIKELLLNYSCSSDTLLEKMEMEKKAIQTKFKELDNLINQIAKELALKQKFIFELFEYDAPTNKKIANNLAKLLSKEKRSAFIVYKNDTTLDRINFILLDFSSQLRYKKSIDEIEKQKQIAKETPRYEGLIHIKNYKKIEQHYKELTN